jgi:hypothetical protein
VASSLPKASLALMAARMPRITTMPYSTRTAMTPVRPSSMPISLMMKSL